MFQAAKSESAIGGKRVRRPLTIVWYAIVIFLGLTLLLVRTWDGNGWLPGLVPRAQRITDSFLECMIPASAFSDVDSHGLSNSAAASIRRQMECWSSSGKWVYDGKPRKVVPNKFGSWSLQQCDERFVNTTAGAVVGERANKIAASGKAADWIVREELKWEWKTDEQRCPLLEVDRDAFCRRIGAKRNMLVVGDSINQELYWILLNHLVVNTSGWKLPRGAGERFTRGDLEVCEDVLGAGQGFRIGYVRNDRLSLIQRVAEDKKTNFMEHPWVNMVEPWNISILLLNRGAHFESNANFTESLINTFSVIKARWPTTQVFFRNTPPGHINCSAHGEPMKERESKEMLLKYRRGHYHWGEFAQQNLIARHITQRFGFVYLDLDAMLATRQDGHSGGNDCLHYCLPGPLDVFVKLFYNSFLLVDPSNSFTQLERLSPRHHVDLHVVL